MCGKGNIVELLGLEGSSSAIDRHQGFFSIIAQHPGINIVSQQYAAWNYGPAYTKMIEILSAQSSIDLVFAHNDRMAVAAYEAARDKDREVDIYFVGIDALPGQDGGIEHVLNGRLNATFIYPTGGDMIIQLALQILKGEEYLKNNILSTAVVDNTNARVLKLQSDQILEQLSKIDYFNTKIDVFISQYEMQRYLLFSAIFIVFLMLVLSLVLFRAYHSKALLNIKLERKNLAINTQNEVLENQRDQLIDLSKKLEEATYAKLMFFTNISHEFRTPLTLISGPVESLLDDPDTKAGHKRLLKLAQRNVDVLLQLVDEIIDFRKYEAGKLTLNIQHGNLREIIESWNEPIVEVARKKHIKMSYHADVSKDFQMDFDLLKTESIYLNLLSNALKFTPSNGYIKICLSLSDVIDQQYIELRITNSGKGIAPDKIDSVFDRYYQIESGAGGSGIGLAIVKAYTELHKGSIEVFSDKSETTFLLRLPIKQSDNEVCNSITDEQRSSSQLSYTTSVSGQQEPLVIEKISNDLPTILVVDDNPDICAYIRTAMERRYTVLEAMDGLSGFRMAMKYLPDLVISDVMMPGIDGVELSRRLKSELVTSHIPVMLLTACSLDEQKVLGYESGADDYISKPFNLKLLEVRVNNLIENRRRLKEKYCEGFFAGNEVSDFDNDTERTFIDKFRKLLEDNYTTPELNIEDLGKRMGLSRSQLYRKVKALTNYSPNELLRIIRLRKAALVFASSELNVAEVAYQTGFSSPSYFAKCFKDYYDESPADYVKRLRQN